MYSWNWNSIIQYRAAFIQGALVTLGLTLLVVPLGTVLGVFVGLLRRNQNPAIALVAQGYIQLFRSLPTLVVLIWVYYVLPILIGIEFPPFLAALLTLSLHLSTFVAETVRASIEAIPKNQYEAGITLGMSPSQVMFFLILPQAFRNMLPNLMGFYITELKNTSLASVIAVNELLHRSNTVIGSTFRPIEVYTTVAVMYLLLITPFTLLAHYIENRLRKNMKSL